MPVSDESPGPSQTDPTAPEGGVEPRDNRSGTPTGPMGMEGLFTPAAGQWRRVQPGLATVRRLSMVPAFVLLPVAVAVGLLLLPSAWDPVLWIGGALLLALLVWWFWLVARIVANYGYVENDDDLWITRGALNRELVVVPYGRMQLVDVTAGWLERRFDLATVVLHTAAATTDAEIPGLRPDEAARLRDRLTELGEVGKSGL